MVTVFCSAIAQTPVNRIVITISIYLFIVLAGLSLVYLSGGRFIKSSKLAKSGALRRSPDCSLPNIVIGVMR